MTDHINPTHAILDAATEPLCLDQIAGKIHGAKPTKAQIKAIERELRELHKATLLESTPGRGGVPYYRLTTPATPTAPQPKAAAVAVQAALQSPTEATAPADITEQLRQSLAMERVLSQAVMEICCAIGSDPQTTVTSQLPKLVKDAITEARCSTTHELAVAVGKIRQAIGDDTNEIALHALDLRISHDYAMAKRDMDEHRELRQALVPITDELFEYYQWYELPWAVRVMAQLIEAQHEHIQDQARDIEAAVTDLTTASRLLTDQEQQIANLRAQLEAQAAQHQSETGLLADKNAKLHAELEHLRSQITPAVTADPAPDAFFVLRHDWKHHVTRHKSRETAERTVTSALRAGAGQADIYAVKRIAIGKRHPVIKPV